MIQAIVILAAGLGRRFGGLQHKALVPLALSEGTLLRLLRQLAVLAPERLICVVLGHRAPQIEVALAERSDKVLCLRSLQRPGESLLSSLVVGLDALAALRDIQGAWVLFADTLYHPRALMRLFQSGTDRPLLAYQPEPEQARGDLIRVRVDPISQRLTALGPELPIGDGVMAPAVYWPHCGWAFVKTAVAQGLTLQWQALCEYHKQGSIQGVAIGPGHAFDIDTRDDLNEALRLLNAPLDVAFFRRSISKEERNLRQSDRIENCAYLKVCTNAESAAIEADALDWLHASPGCRVPQRSARNGRILELEPISGIRLYDLLRLLRSIEQAECADCAVQASSASLVLLRRSLAQLFCVQRALMLWPPGLGQPAYPFSLKVTGLLAILFRMLGLPGLQPVECRELQTLDHLWQTSDVRLPFRDATAKNIIVRIPELAPSCGDSPDVRMAKLGAWLEREESEVVELVDIDITSVLHRTAPEDDLFSLLAHAGSLPVGKRLLAELVPGISTWPNAVAELVRFIDPALQRDDRRAARALLVRYLRFGGRKLLYRIVNPAAFSVRFRHDDPGFYFLQLPDLLIQLDPGFPASCPGLLTRLYQLREAVALLPAWKAEEARHDLYRSRLGVSIPYWQESTLELPARETASFSLRG
jgi:CTP:molybdopterin cytidylyltransferase MocA